VAQSYDLALIKVDMTWGSHGGDYEDGCLLGCSGLVYLLVFLYYRLDNYSV
jgi:hypothetical protein